MSNSVTGFRMPFSDLKIEYPCINIEPIYIYKATLVFFKNVYQSYGNFKIHFHCGARHYSRYHITCY